jgi:hypothetical protein
MPWDWIKGRRHNWFCYDIWNIGVVNKNVDEICPNGRLDGVVCVPRQPKYEFIEDPFVLKTASAQAQTKDSSSPGGTRHGSSVQPYQGAGRGESSERLCALASLLSWWSSSNTCEAAKARSFDAGSRQELDYTGCMPFWIGNATLSRIRPNADRRCPHH